VASLANITFACEEPVRLAEFWAAALGYVPLEVPPAVQEQVERAIEEGKLDPTGWAMLVDPAGRGPRLLFQRRRTEHTSSIPIHLDLSADDPNAEAERLLELGAELVETGWHRIGAFEERWIVMRDPEGNGFCVQ
jgi:Glyoxalase-like domain